MSATVAASPRSGVDARPALVRAEFLKVVTTKMWLGLLAGVVVFVAIQVAVTALAPSSPQNPVPPLTSDAGMRNLFSGVGQATVFALIIGVLGITQEYRHQTITAAFLASPHRARVMTAKMLGHVLVGAFYGAVAVVTGFAIAFVTLTFKDHAPIQPSVLLQIGGGVVLVYALYAVLGVAVGALIKNQIAAILVVIVWSVFVEALVILLLPSVGKWLPGGAVDGIRQAAGFENADYLSPLPAALLLLAYALVLATLAARTTLRRDVT